MTQAYAQKTLGLAETEDDWNKGAVTGRGPSDLGARGSSCEDQVAWDGCFFPPQIPLMEAEDGEEQRRLNASQGRAGRGVAFHCAARLNSFIKHSFRAG